MRKAGNKRSDTAKAVVFICAEAGGETYAKQQLQVAASSRWPIIHPNWYLIIIDIGCQSYLHQQVPLEPADFSSSLPWVQGLHPCDDEEVESVHKASFDVRKNHKAALWSFVSVKIFFGLKEGHM